MSTKSETAAKGDKTKAVKADAEGRVAGVLLAKVKPEVLDQYLTKNKLPLDGTLEEKVDRAVRYYRKVTPKKEIADCNTCGGDSDARPEVCPVCPYCGDGEFEAGAAAGKAAPAAPATPAAAPAAPTNGKAATPAPSAVKAAAAPAAAPTSKKGKAGLAAAAPAAVEGGDQPDPRFTVADLDKALAAVDLAKQGEVGSYWDHGQAVREIFTKKLHLQRRDKAGQPKYKTWAQFCAEELGMTSNTAYRIMDVAEHYDRPTAVKLGVRKLNAILRIDDEGQRAKMLPKAEKMSADELEVEVRKVVEAAGKTADRGRGTAAQKDQRAKAGAKATEKRNEGKKGNVSKPAAAKPGADTITAALVLGKTTIKLFAKGAKITDEKAKRAKKLGDGPFGVEETVNGVTTRYTISADAKGCLVLVAERRRAG